MTIDTVRLTTADGVRIALAHYRLPRAPAAIVVCPGFFQNRHTPRFRGIAAGLARAGFDVLVFDFRGHGQSGGWYTFGRREAADLLAVLDFARPRYRKLGVMGFSMGATVAILTLAHAPLADALMAISPVADPNAIVPWTIHWRGVVRTWWRHLGVKRPFRGLSLHYGTPKALDAVGGISPMPLLLVHGTRDWLVAARHSRWLAERAGEPKELRLIESDCHAEEFYEADPEEFLSLSSAWFERALGVQGGRAA